MIELCGTVLALEPIVFGRLILSQKVRIVNPKTALHKFGWIIFALAGMTLWAAMALADDGLEIGKTY